MSAEDVFLFGLLIFAFSSDGGFGEFVGALLMLVAFIK